MGEVYRARDPRLGPQDLTGASSPGLPAFSVDGKHYVYQVVRNLSDLYVVDGLK